MTKHTQTLGQSRLTIVGLGIVTAHHLTTETVSHLRDASVVLVLSPRAAELKRLNRNVVSLENLYWSNATDWGTYRRIAKIVVGYARRTRGGTVFAVDGNPAIFDDVVWEAYRLAKKASLSVSILPGISAVDIAPIELRFDPGNVGLQVVEANQLVVYDVTLNPYFSTLILQIGWFGSSILRRRHRQTSRSVEPLVQHLLKFYPTGHLAFLLSVGSPATELFRTTVGGLRRDAGRIHSGMTLYLPRREVAVVNRSFYESLFDRARRSKEARSR